MEAKEKGNVTVEKGKRKPVRCYKFRYPSINRELMVHEDIDNKNHTSVSDCATGYRLFGLPKTLSSIKFSDIEERLDKFIKHYTEEGIAEEFKRIEALQEQGGTV